MLDTIIDIYEVGSILNVPANTAQTPAEWDFIISTIQKRAIAATGIPIIYCVDEIHGTIYTAGGTLFPQEIAM